jgi:hypothetical protein
LDIDFDMADYGKWPMTMAAPTLCESGHFTGPSVGPTDVLLYWLYYFLQSGRLQALLLGHI